MYPKQSVVDFHFDISEQISLISSAVNTVGADGAGTVLGVAIAANRAVFLGFNENRFLRALGIWKS